MDLIQKKEDEKMARINVASDIPVLENDADERGY
jgi:hypothetical protein